jgi:uncharacterized membrane protein SirB2
MEVIHYLMFFHLIGFGMFFSVVLAGWILHHKYLNAGDNRTKGVLLGTMRPIGLLSPLAILIMLVTGIGNMHIRGLGLFSEPWLSTKIVFFLLASVNGIYFGARSGRRRKLVAQLENGTAAAGTDARIAAFDRQMRIFYIVQCVLLLTILVLSIVKPGPPIVPH